MLIDKSEIRFVSKQMGVNVEGRFRRWKANIVFLPKELAKSKAEFDIDLGSIDLASDESETEIKSPLWFDTAKFPVAQFVSTSIKDVGGDKYESRRQAHAQGSHQGCRGADRAQEGCERQQRRRGQLPDQATRLQARRGQWADTEMVAERSRGAGQMVLPPTA